MDKKKIVLIAAVAAVVLALLVTCIVLIVKLTRDDTPPVITPDYPAPPAEEGAEDIGDDEEKLEAPTGGGAVGLVYSDEITVDLSDKKAIFRFDNPSRSTQNISIMLQVQDVVIFETGTLTPGKRVTEIALREGAEAQLQEGVYANNAKFVVYFYDPVSNERAVVNSEIAVTVTVQP
jgi:hypothetical protein